MKPASLSLESIRSCFEGAIPSVLATCSADGVPNVSYLSQVEYVDATHVALTFQFFNTTRRNILANPHATLMVVHPFTGANYRLRLRYLRTEMAGPLFEKMKAKLAGIASHEGMTGVFRLQGSDVYRVEHVEEIPGHSVPYAAPRRNLLAAVRTCAQSIASHTDLAELFDGALQSLRDHLAIEHAMLLINDPATARLYAVASLGYERMGVGFECALGEGVIGVAARERTPIRIGFIAPEYAYGRAIRESAAASGLAQQLAQEIPFPGLAAPHSQIAVPIVAGARLLGVLYAESERDLHFGYDEEDALVAIAAPLGMAIQALQSHQEAAESGVRAVSERATESGAPVTVRYFAENHSVFLDDGYLIKGVAGSIFWAVASDYVQQRRTEFTNRELRLDPRIRLPDLSDNLEARLILLQRRLVERDACVRLEKAGRGRFRLQVQRPLKLQAVPTPA